MYKISKAYSLISVCTNFKASACHALMFGGPKDEVSGLFSCSVQVWRDIVTQQKELSWSEPWIPVPPLSFTSPVFYNL